jgi:hypothetical protein
LTAIVYPAPCADTSSEARLEFETLIADTSAALISASPADIDAVVEAALERLRGFFGVDRAGLLAVASDGTSVRISHTAYGPGIARVPLTFDLERSFPWAYRQTVIERRPVAIVRMADLPPEADTSGLPPISPSPSCRARACLT